MRDVFSSNNGIYIRFLLRLLSRVLLRTTLYMAGNGQLLCVFFHPLICFPNDSLGLCLPILPKRTRETHADMQLRQAWEFPHLDENWCFLHCSVCRPLENFVISFPLA